MKTKIFTFLLLAAFLILAGCAEKTSDSAIEGESVNAKTVVIYQDNFSFHPDYVIIEEGDTIKWINNDTAASVIRGSSFQSPTLREGDSFSYTFEKTGTYDYFLISHPWTRGGIVVVE
ncbi:MAG: hypothetical protein SCH66_04515 [Methanolobus sp.]|nr:hypothetical protein [Methanolobus sp.]